MNIHAETADLLLSIMEAMMEAKCDAEQIYLTLRSIVQNEDMKAAIQGFCESETDREKLS